MALDREAEVRHLAQADMHISDAERKITHQSAIVEQMHAAGHDTKEADRMLVTFKEVLETLWAHRDLIIDTIRQIDDGSI